MAAGERRGFFGGSRSAWGIGETGREDEASGHSESRTKAEAQQIAGHRRATRCEPLKRFSAQAITSTLCELITAFNSAASPAGFVASLRPGDLLRFGLRPAIPNGQSPTPLSRISLPDAIPQPRPSRIS